MTRDVGWRTAGSLLLCLLSTLAQADDPPRTAIFEARPLMGGGTYYRGPASGKVSSPLVIQQPPKSATTASSQDKDKNSEDKTSEEQTAERPAAFSLAQQFNQQMGLNQGYTLNQSYIPNQGFTLNQGYSLNQNYAPNQGLTPGSDPTRIQFDDEGNRGSPFQYRMSPSGYPVQYNDHFYPGSYYSNQAFYPGFLYSRQSLNVFW